VAAIACALICALSLAAPSAHAKEPWLLDLEASAGTPLTKPQSRWYGVGGSLALSVQKPFASWFALTARLRTAGFLDGDTPSQAGTKNPSFGTLNAVAAGVVFRLPTHDPRPGLQERDVRRGTGLWLDAVGGAGLTGTEVRGLFEVGVGYGFAIKPRISLAPVVRYIQVIQPDGGLSGADAKLGLLGLRVTLFDKVPEKELPPPLTPPIADQDGDGIEDRVDQCIDMPEDKDDFEDADGCPEQDNDQDGILDSDDSCPNIAEDRDGFQDEDGCLDDDNDRDGFLDPDDKCPLEPEVINGEQDDDGCPDTGLIVMEDDRIVLAERVLFDTDRARLNKSGEPVLRAIVRLWRQHPEWKKVRIEGHADARGDEPFNQQLSERRAANVRDTLIRLGMRKELVTAEGFGARQLISHGNAEEDHQANRRVEFVVIARDVTPLAPGSAPAKAAPEQETSAPDAQGPTSPPPAPASVPPAAAPADAGVPSPKRPVAPSAAEAAP
jgi:outer membrane protein OmpA-like peptidoglycan-associated protein